MSLLNEPLFVLESTPTENIYDYDRIFLTELYENEIWDFNNFYVSYPSLSFLFLRALIYKNRFQHSPSYLNFHNSIKVKIIKSGVTELFNKFLPEMHLPELVSADHSIDNIITAENPRLNFYKSFKPDSRFYIDICNNNENRIIGGGISESDLLAKNIVEELFSIYHLNQCCGQFYLRTVNHSYLYFLNPGYKSKVFFIQPKKKISPEFYYFHIKIEL